MNLLTGVPPELLDFALPLLFFFGFIVLFAIVWFVCAMIPDHRQPSPAPAPVIHGASDPVNQLPATSDPKPASPQ